MSVAQPVVRYGLIGGSLSHSFSQRFFTEKFEREGLHDHRYDLFPLTSIEEFPRLLEGTPGLRGLNVTIPYKQSIIPYLHRLDPLAAAVGAVNTITLDGGELVGHNTDVQGFREALLPLLGKTRPRALVLGSGGASRAVAYILKEQGIKFRVVSRDRSRGDLTYDLLEPIVVDVCTLIINTTPLGTYPDVHERPRIPYEAIGERHVLMDLVYNPERTAFLEAGAERGATVSNGLAMLHAQALASWDIWHRPADQV